MTTNADLESQLQAEFCPPLDAALVAAFVGELDKNPAPSVMRELRQTLAELAAHAAPDDEFDAAPIIDESEIASPLEALSVTDSSSDPASLATSTSFSSVDAPSANATPLEFLRAIFPHVDDATLTRALGDARSKTSNDNESALDMEAVIAGLMSTEYIRELAERGLDASDMHAAGSLEEDTTPWVLVNSPQTRRSVAPKARKPKARTIALADVRQQHNRRDGGAARPAPDPWIQISSLSARLSELTPKPPPFFAPFFHSPKYPTPAHAVRAALATAAGAPDGVEEHIAAPVDAPALYTLFEVICAGEDFDALDAEQRARVMTDAQLALAAAGSGAPDAALDLVGLLRELDADNAEASVMGLYHSAAPSLAKKAAVVPASPGRPRSNTAGSAKSAGSVLSMGSVLSAPSSPQLRFATATAVPVPAVDGWQAVPERRATGGASPYAAFIPAYQYASVRPGAAGAPRRIARAEQKAVERARKRVAELQERRDRAVREASRQWRKGGPKDHAGEVALYFAEQARALQEAARREALNATREMVLARRAGGSTDIDLHGATASEAIIIVREILGTEPCSPSEPITVITGKGTHSMGGVSVLGPAVRNALTADGWNIAVGEGSLVVRGKLA